MVAIDSYRGIERNLHFVSAPLEQGHKLRTSRAALKDCVQAGS